MPKLTAGNWAQECVNCGPAQLTSWSMIGKNSCTALGLALRRFSSVLITAERAGEVASCAATGSTGRLCDTKSGVPGNQEILGTFKGLMQF